MNQEAVSIHLKQIKNPLPIILIVIVWLLTTYFLYTHKAQKPEVKKISDRRVLQIKISSRISPTPKLNDARSSQTNGNFGAEASQDNANVSAISQDTTSANNSEQNSSSNDSNIISPTQVPVTSNMSEEESIPTVTPQPTSDENENSITPTPTAEQSSNDNSPPVINNLATTVDNLTQTLPLDLISPGNN